MCRRHNFFKYTLSFATGFVMWWKWWEMLLCCIWEQQTRTECEKHCKNYLEKCKKLRICQNIRFVGQLNTLLASLMAIFYYRLLILDYNIEKHWKGPFQLLWKHTLKNKKINFLGFVLKGIWNNQWKMMRKIRELVQQMEKRSLCKQNYVQWEGSIPPTSLGQCGPK